MLREILLAELTPSPTNPRKTFDPVKLQELADSIASKGMLEPILVRPRPPKYPVRDGVEVRPPFDPAPKENYEVVAGERRFRAAGLAKLETVPCIVRELNDVEVLEVQTIENLQRDDLHPLEEAEGYAALMKEAGYDIEQIAQRIGKSTRYVYDRVKLLQLVPALRKVFLEGEISVGHAILLARLSPTDQERANGSSGTQAQLIGLWAHDYGAQEYGLELGDKRRRKPVSIRELEAWISNNVRFRPNEVDLPNLFPETAVALKAAEEEELKLVKITREHRVSDGARDLKERTYGRQSWKRADGQPDRDPWDRRERKTKTCEHSVVGVIVAGPGRGEAFHVCVAKKKCTVHWKEEQEAANERGAPNGAGTAAGKSAAADSYQARQRRWDEERKRDDAERARWRKAQPKLLEALAEKLKATPAPELAGIVVEKCLAMADGGRKLKQMQLGETLDDAVRYAAFLVLSLALTNDWNAPTMAPKALKKVGIDARKIVDKVAPKPKEAKAEKPAPAEGKKPGARARRRGKKVAAAAPAEAET